MANSIDMVLSWSKPHEFDFLQEEIDKDEYRTLCTMHVYIAKINNHLFKINSGMLADATKAVVPDTIDFTVIAIRGHNRSTAALLQWIETSVANKFLPTPSDLENMLTQVFAIRDTVKKVAILYEMQRKQAHRLPDDHARLKKDFEVVMDTLHQLELLVFSRQSK